MVRGSLLCTFLIIVVAVGASAPAKADEPVAHAGHNEAEDSSIWKGSVDLALWTVVVFLVLLFVLRKFAWGPMLEGLEKREQAIAAAVLDAQKARDEAARMREQLAAEMAKANERARQIMEEARRDAQRMGDEMLARAKTDIATERDRLYRELNVAKDQALQEMWQQSAQLATLIAAKAIGRQINLDDQRTLLNEALNEMQGAVADREGFMSGKA